MDNSLQLMLRDNASPKFLQLGVGTKNLANTPPLTITEPISTRRPQVRTYEYMQHNPIQGCGG